MRLGGEWDTDYAEGTEQIEMARSQPRQWSRGKRLSFPGPVHQLDFTDDSRHLVTGNFTIFVVHWLHQSRRVTP